MNEIAQLTQTLGFPIVVCLWFMFRTEKVINNNTKALNQFIDLNRK